MILSDLHKPKHIRIPKKIAEEVYNIALANLQEQRERGARKGKNAKS